MEALSLVRGITFASLLIGWAIVVAVLALAVFRSRPAGATPLPARLRAFAAGLILEEWILAGMILLIGGVTLMLALVCPPNNWDSQTYHLPRIEHWIQNGSLEFYRTDIDRQLEMPPFAELLLLPFPASDRRRPAAQSPAMAGGRRLGLPGRPHRRCAGFLAPRRGAGPADRRHFAHRHIGEQQHPERSGGDLLPALHGRTPAGLAHQPLGHGCGLLRHGRRARAGGQGHGLSHRLPAGALVPGGDPAGKAAIRGCSLLVCGLLLLLPNLPGYVRNLDYSGSPLGDGALTTNNTAFGLGPWW